MGWTPASELWLSVRGGDLFINDKSGPASEAFSQAKLGSRGLVFWMLGEHVHSLQCCASCYCTLASCCTYLSCCTGFEMTRKGMLVAAVAACFGLTMVGSLGSETGQQIKSLAIFMQSSLLKKGMGLFLETTGSCCDTLGNCVSCKTTVSTQQPNIHANNEPLRPAVHA